MRAARTRSTIRRGPAALAAITVSVAALGIEPPPAAGADTPGCVSEAEYLQVSIGMAKARVHQIFDTRGKFLDGAAGGYTRGYRECGNTDNLVIVEYAATATSAQFAKKRWTSPDRGDIRVWQGTNAGDAFDLVDRKGVRRDHVYAGGGRDYVFMKADGYRDVIRCGPGRDLVQFLDRREARDVYRGCEKVQRYSP